MRILTKVIKEKGNQFGRSGRGEDSIIMEINNVTHNCWKKELNVG